MKFTALSSSLPAWLVRALMPARAPTPLADPAEALLDEIALLESVLPSIADCARCYA